MKMTKLAVLVPVLVAVLSAGALAGDIIQQASDRWLPSPPTGRTPTASDFQASTLTVTDENYDFTFYRFENIPQKQRLDTSAVVKVWYENRPTPYIEASQAMGQGQYDVALQRFESVATGRSYPDWARMYSLWDMGRIYQLGMGDFERAVQVWDRLKSDFPRSKFLPDAIVYAGKALLALDRTDDARNKFLELERLPGLPEGKKALGRYYVIYIKQKQGESSGNTALINQALSEYRRLLSEVEGDPALKEVATLARLGIGDCLLALEKYGEALDFFQRIAQSGDDKAVLAGAYNGLGKCYLAQQKWKDALLAFLRTVVLYDESPEQSAMALTLAAESYRYLRSGDDWEARAKGLYRECIQRFPGTQWARKANQGLQQMR